MSLVIDPILGKGLFDELARRRSLAVGGRKGVSGPRAGGAGDIHRDVRVCIRLVRTGAAVHQEEGEAHDRGRGAQRLEPSGDDVR
jgi:hypothetical protein